MKLIITSLILSLAVSAEAQSNTFKPFADLLSNYVLENNLENGGYETAFDYASAKNDAKTSRILRRQDQILKRFDTSTLTTKEAANAFYINAYNYFMITKIIKDGFNNGVVVDGVKSFGSLLNPFKVFTQKEFDIGGKLHSLDEIEKEILLGSDFKSKGWKDARVHFAVNCASVGCPPLIPQVYDASTIDAVLDDNVRKAFKTNRHLQIDGNTLRLTKLFDWYEKDFTDEAGSIKAYIKPYLDASKQSGLDKTNRIRFINYDWSLNIPANF